MISSASRERWSIIDLRLRCSRPCGPSVSATFQQRGEAVSKTRSTGSCMARCATSSTIPWRARPEGLSRFEVTTSSDRCVHGSRRRDRRRRSRRIEVELRRARDEVEVLVDAHHVPSDTSALGDVVERILNDFDLARGILPSDLLAAIPMLRDSISWRAVPARAVHGAIVSRPRMSHELRAAHRRLAAATAAPCGADRGVARPGAGAPADAPYGDRGAASGNGRTDGNDDHARSYDGRW